MKLFNKKLGAGDPLIILHGLFGSLDNWQTIGSQLAEQGFEVYLVDQRNHGHSPHSDVWDYEVMSDDLKELIEDNKLSKVSIVGHSMGGKTAMMFTTKYPHLVKKLVVVDMAPKYYPTQNANVIKALEAVNVEQIRSRKEAEEILKKLLPGDVATQQFLLKNLYWLDAENKKMAWRFNLETIATNIKNIGKEINIDKCSVPTLFIRGEKSDYIKEADLLEIQHKFPLSELKTIEKAGHWVHADQPQKFLEMLIEFLKQE